jgi:hypothetical protein
MAPPSKKAIGRSYIVRCIIGVAAWIVFASVATDRVLSASQLSTAFQFVVCAFLWGIIVHVAFMLWRDYRNLPDE